MASIVDVFFGQTAYNQDITITVNVGTASNRCIEVYGTAGGGISFTGATIDGTLVTAQQTGTDPAGKAFGLAVGLVTGTGNITVVLHYSAVGNTKYYCAVGRDGIASIRNTGVASPGSSAAPSIT